jgi:hypothetical protein
MSSGAIKAGGAEIEIGARDKTNSVFNRIARRMTSFGGIGKIASGGFKLVSGAVSGLASMAKKATASMLVMTGAMTAFGVKSIMTLASTGDRLHKMSLRTGVAVESLSALGFAAEQSGSDLNQLGNALFRMQRRIGNFSTGGGPAKRALEELGYAANDLTGMKTEDMFFSVVKSLEGIEDPALKAQYAYEIFGNQAKQLMPLLLSGAEGIRELAYESDRLGGTVSRNQANIGAGLTDSFGRVSTATLGMFRKVGEKIGPIVIEMLDKVAYGIASIAEPIGNVAIKIVSIFSAAASMLAPVFQVSGTSIIDTIGDWIDQIPGMVFESFRVWESLTTAIANLWMELSATVQTIVSQILSGEALLQAQGKVADLLIDLQAAAGFITDIEAAEIKKTRAEDTERAAQNNPAIAEARRQQQQIADDLAEGLASTNADLVSKLENISELENQFNKERNDALAKTFDMGAASQMLKDIFSGAESSMESVATKTIPNALQRGTIEAFRQGEQNKKANKPLIDAMNNVAAKTEEVNTTIEDKLNFQPVG